MPWQLLIYMAADNDLAAQAVRSLADIARTGGSREVEVRVMIDLRRKGAREYQFPSGAVQPLGPIDTGDPKFLRDFIARGGPATGRKTAVIIWNHGGGTLGIDKGARGDFLTNIELAGRPQSEWPEDRPVRV
jgi:hypothetical protein